MKWAPAQLNHEPIKSCFTNWCKERANLTTNTWLDVYQILGIQHVVGPSNCGKTPLAVPHLLGAAHLEWPGMLTRSLCLK